MSKLIQKVEWNLDGFHTEMYMYDNADFEANKAMQEPLEKLYQYENSKEVTSLEDGVTTCCGYDFGTDLSNNKIKYCPICGKMITK